LSTSISTLLRCAFGDFDYNSVVSANRVLGPVFFFMWLLYAAVILLNMAIAIISEAFVKVRSFICLCVLRVVIERPCAVIVLLKCTASVGRFVDLLFCRF
jgi:hypothetical protein